MQRVAITTLGCKTNQFESAGMGEILGKEGFVVVPFDEQADVYIINTCTVTARTDAESRRLIRRAQRKTPNARIVVTGCYAQVAPEELRALPGVDLILGNTEKKDIVSFLREAPAEGRVLVSDITGERHAAPLALESFAEHTRAFLQVQNGCDAFCSYCIVPYARGRSRSVSTEEVLKGIASFAASGYQEVVLTGIHLSAYGLDLEPPASLHGLLQEVERRQLVPRLRLGSLEPAEIGDELIDLVARSKVICPHIHIPLQSGADGVLHRMNRTYTARFFAELVGRLSAAVPGICIGLDMIAGFPGETEEEFLAGWSLVESLPIAYLHVFPYSLRPGTAAASMSGHLPPRVITERARRLRELSERKRDEYHACFVGKTIRVLVQSSDGSGNLKGLSRHYVSVSFPGNRDTYNREVTVRILGSSGEGLVGELQAVL
ncbi:tRNA (N(6)-L-threonylcarbamoyladenosine(37)-C(2))-methylthiotransferase MtaB [Geobacter sp. DSM 9736]|uniref:tRNA (N(6)-L-threonylcarbamoyladenosine(37)-C(2))- methylthiotransferase MtaB n=1 Tax=Geobacter sp. DSM 9736 TaxID=1277350 RepID=UPI000B50626B|nr:tRNA (N(6)-L-threonylcarbamoyladenosine(37)-C(2))-methylthiotransferase MtaB [Geobacter sp. DSM 9736]SNB44860.1 threonylcarbamoyladenosine tRNA methylthiotransferase MtaB [Geobacter sp. DSM 9736]